MLKVREGNRSLLGAEVLWVILRERNTCVSGLSLSLGLSSISLLLWLISISLYGYSVNEMCTRL